MSSNRLQQWPADQLEALNSCPVCGGEKQSPLASGLIDWMSKPPTGLWHMITCGDCAVAYLSPRPVSESIADAYSHYYTHTSDKDDLVDSRLRRVKERLANRYYTVSSGSGSLLDYCVYGLTRIIIPVSSYLDAKSRHIFKIHKESGRLLDIGCGNGEFLRFAKEYGWTVVGVDFDQHAVSEAASDGLDVRMGSIEDIDHTEQFDLISISHVIEHVYNPAEFIHSCYSLLKPGGTLWLETPNIESMGYSLYQSNWRGFEPPRHLILFNRDALREMCLKSGFVSVEQKLHGLSGLYMGLVSERLLHKATPCDSVVTCSLRGVTKFVRVSCLELAQMFSKRRREFITLIAKR